MHNSIPENLYYTPSHEWVKQDSQNPSLVYIGITEHAQQHLGDVVYLSLPVLNQEVEAGEDCCVIESVKAASDIYSPLAGKVTAINDTLREQPGLINADPYSNWIFSIKISSVEGLDNLLNAQEYQALLDEAHD